MKKRSLSLLLAVCLMLTFASAAWATEGADVLPDVQDVAETPAEATEPAATTEEAPAASEPAEEPVEELAEEPADVEDTVPDTEDAEAPYVKALAFTVNGENRNLDVYGGNWYLQLEKDVSIRDCAVSVTTSEPVTFVENETPPAGALYVSSYLQTSNTVAFNFNATVSGADMNGSLFRLYMQSSDGEVWTSNNSLLSNLADVQMAALATGLSAYDNIGLAAGAMKSVETGATSAFWRILCNQDSENVWFIFCNEDCTTYTVTYNLGNATYEWELPANAPLLTPTMQLASGLTFEGWYSDSSYSEQVEIDADTTVTKNMTLYAKITGSTDGFAAQIEGNETVLTINSLEDFNVFAQRASEIDSDRRVRLGNDIDCNNTTYTAITFSGDFDGNGKTISNATFNANGDNSGMFATIGAGQVIANLTLSNITVNYGENAGVLAGSISATNSSPALIQNVQIRGGTVKGRNMGALVGYTFLSNIKYCSSRDTTFSGLVNAGGIAGISYSVISNCYSTCDLSQFTMSKGGIVAKNQEAGRVEWCWTTYSKVIASSHADSSEENNFENFSKYNTVAKVSKLGFDTTYWALGAGADTGFKDAVYYNFS
jgi:uncharacterized repeat protein (TIGR02543 family)